MRVELKEDAERPSILYGSGDMIISNAEMVFESFPPPKNSGRGAIKLGWVVGELNSPNYSRTCRLETVSLKRSWAIGTEHRVYTFPRTIGSFFERVRISWIFETFLPFKNPTLVSFIIYQ